MLTKTLDNRTVLIEKGIWQYLQYIKPDELLHHRLLAGFNKQKSINLYYFPQVF